MSRLSLPGLTAALLGLATMARAEPPGPIDRSVYLSLGLDGAMAATAGFATGLPVLQRLALAGYADATWAAGGLDLGDLRFRVGLRAEVVRRGPFRLRVGVAPTLRLTSTDAFTAQAIGTELQLAPGIDLGRWSAQLELGVEQVWLTHITPSDWYHDNVDAAAQSAWYQTTARTVRVGLGGAVRLARTELSLRVGWERTGSLDFLPPLYGAIGVAYRF